MAGRAQKSSSRLVRKNPAPQSRILRAVHETAGDLLEAGFIDKRRMRAYDQLCLPPMREYSADSIRALRNQPGSACGHPQH
jgi:DNA-binding transcriptional regulator YiaG